MLLPGRKLPHLGLGVHRQVVACCQLSQAAFHHPGRADERGAGQAEGHVLGHGVGVDQFEVLVDHADAVGDGVPGAPYADPFSSQVDGAGVGLVQAVEGVHEGGFAGAVFPEQGVDLSRPDLEGDVVVGPHAGEGFHDVLHEELGVVLRGLFMSTGHVG